MGCRKLTAAALPMWPNIGDTWPTTSDGKLRLTRFRFEEPDTHPDNVASLDRIFEFLNTHGAQYSAAAAPALRMISPKDLRERVIWKFKELQKVLRTGKRLPQRKNNAPGAEGPAASASSTVEIEEIVVLTKSQCQSRAKGVCCKRVSSVTESLSRRPFSET